MTSTYHLYFSFQGDEEAGEAARAKADLKRDQMQTKELIDAVVYGKDKFKTLRNQSAILNEDEKAVRARQDGVADDDLEELEEFDDEAYYLQKMKARDEEIRKEMEKQRLREQEEAEAEAEEAENANVSEMNEEERRQHEADKLLHNKVAKEFMIKVTSSSLCLSPFCISFLLSFNRCSLVDCFIVIPFLLQSAATIDFLTIHRRRDRKPRCAVCSSVRIQLVLQQQQLPGKLLPLILHR